MTIKPIDLGSGPGARDGDTAFAANTKINENFAEILTRLQSIERLRMPYGSYTEPGTQPYIGPLHGTTAWTDYQSVSQHIETDTITSLTAQNGTVVIAMSPTRFLSLTKVSTTLTGKVFELADGVITRVAQATSSGVAVHTSGSILGVVATSENTARATIQNAAASSPTLHMMDVTYADGVLTMNVYAASPVGTAGVGAGSIYSSKTIRAAALNSSSLMTLYMSRSSALGCGICVQRFSAAGASTQHLESVIAATTESPSISTLAFDHIGGDRYVIAHPTQSFQSYGHSIAVTIISADDNAVLSTGTVLIPGSVPTGGVSVFAVSASLAYVTWRTDAGQRMAAISVTEAGSPVLLGPPTVSGVVTNAIVCGAAYSDTELLAGVWSEDGSNISLTKIAVDTATGQISSGDVIPYATPWTGTSGRFADMIRLSEDRVLVVSFRSGSPYGMALDVIDLE